MLAFLSHGPDCDYILTKSTCTLITNTEYNESNLMSGATSVITRFDCTNHSLTGCPSEHERAGLAGRATAITASLGVFSHMTSRSHSTALSNTNNSACRCGFTVHALSGDQTSPIEFANKLHILIQEMLPNDIQCA